MRGLGLVKDEAERARAGFHGRQRVFAIGDAADLDEHQATSSRRARAASPDFIRCSPTRKASKPASSQAADVGALKMPLSLTLRTPAGICRRKVDRSFERDLKRAQIAVVHADDFGAGIERDVKFPRVVDFDQRGHGESRASSRKSRSWADRGSRR